jgi:hypothetical protein
MTRASSRDNVQTLEITVKLLPDGRMDVNNAARYLGLAPHTLAKKRCDGTGPKFVKRGRVFYYRTDLDDWLRAGRTGSTAATLPAGAKKSSGKR